MRYSDDLNQTPIKKIKSPQEMIDEVLTIQNGHFKGAKVAFTTEIVKKLMEDYHEQFEEEKLKTN